jgi:hypothetical protein
VTTPFYDKATATEIVSLRFCRALGLCVWRGAVREGKSGAEA